MNRSCLLLPAACLLLGPAPAVAQAFAAPPGEPQVAGVLDLDRNLPAIARSLAAAPDVFDMQLAQGILRDLGALPRLGPLTRKAAPGYRLGKVMPLPQEPGLAALGNATIDGGPLAIEWSQQFDGPALAGKLGVRHAGGPIEVRLDLDSRLPLATPTAASLSFDTAAWVRVLPALRLGAAASGPIETRAGRTIGPEARLTVPGLGGSLDAEAGWRMPVRSGAEVPQPGVVNWSVSFRKPL